MSISPSTEAVRNLKYNSVTLKFSDPGVEALYLSKSMSVRRRTAIQIHAFLWPQAVVACTCNRVLIIGDSGEIPQNVSLGVGASTVIFGWVLATLLRRNTLNVDGTVFICCHYISMLCFTGVFLALSLESWEAMTVGAVLGALGMTPASTRKRGFFLTS